MRDFILFLFVSQILSCIVPSGMKVSTINARTDEHLGMSYKVDSIIKVKDLIYQIYISRDGYRFKVVTLVNEITKCENVIEVGQSYKLKLKSILSSDTSITDTPERPKVFSQHIDTFIYYTVEIKVEKNIVPDIFESPNLNGLCLKNQE